MQLTLTLGRILPDPTIMRDYCVRHIDCVSRRDVLFTSAFYPFIFFPFCLAGKVIVISETISVADDRHRLYSVIHCVTSDKEVLADLLGGLRATPLSVTRCPGMDFSSTRFGKDTSQMEDIT